MTLNDLERPIHLKVRLTDGSLDVRMVWLSDLTNDHGGSNGAISSTIKSKMATGGLFENFKWPYFCNAVSVSLHLCTHYTDHILYLQTL